MLASLALLEESFEESAPELSAGGAGVTPVLGCAGGACALGDCAGALCAGGVWLGVVWVGAVEVWFGVAGVCVAWPFAVVEAAGGEDCAGVLELCEF